MDLTTWAAPVFLALIALEVFLSARQRARGASDGQRGYAQRDSWASISMGLGSLVVGVATKWLWFGMYTFAYQFRLFDLGTGPLVFLAALLGDDFFYYWYHRLHHEVRFMWAGHVVHHSSRHFNLSTALRQPWTTFMGPLFYLPLPLLGFDPLLLVTVHSVNLLYQFWIHTELIDRLGPFEWVFNTPSHHRVHHGRNVRYLDRNHGGILIVWDRLFGTFEPEREAVDYGLTKNITSHSPWEIFAHEWRAMWRDARNADTWGDALRVGLMPPGWSRDGSTLTADELRRSLPDA
ncbi:MAG TPA: sterol desaturase family protein [Myxococcota bacterium]|nr:sterol desaturase family protein [Myxococcota bacterium]